MEMILERDGKEILLEDNVDCKNKLVVLLKLIVN